MLQDEKNPQKQHKHMAEVYMNKFTEIKTLATGNSPIQLKAKQRPSLHKFHILEIISIAKGEKISLFNLHLFLTDVGTSMIGCSTCSHHGSHHQPPLQTSSLKHQTCCLSPIQEENLLYTIYDFVCYRVGIYFK